MEGYCSWCFEKIVPQLVTKNKLIRDTYLCPKCNRRIAKCRACCNFACWDSFVISTQDGHKKEVSQHDQFCAEHRHVVANFETLKISLSDPTEFPRVLSRTKHNLAKYSKVTLFSIGGITITSPFAYFAAPALGGAIGTSFMGLHGIAATNAGLAFLGGGSLAAGGFGIAGGMVVITIAGSALGGTVGAQIASEYLNDIKGFEIIKVKSGIEPSVMTIDGFLSQEDEGFDRWMPTIQKYYPDNSWYHLKWESKRLSDLGSMFSGQADRFTLANTIKKAAKTATKKASVKIGPACTLFDIMSLSKNPWHIAFVKAERTGVILADILKRCDNQKFVLIGHSLGAKVVYSALATLSSSDYANIETVYLLGGAVSNTTNNWSAASKCIINTIHNYYSSNDWILKYLYTLGTFFSSNPCGHMPILDVNKVNNHDVSDVVKSHMEYVPNFPSFYVS